MAAPVFDASALSSVVSTQTNTLPISWSHTVGAGANNCGVVAVVNTNGGAGSFAPTGTPTASIGATSLTYLGSVLFNNAASLGFVAVWAGLLVPAGAQTVSTSVACAGQSTGNAYGVSCTYTGVGSVGTLQTAFGSSTSPSVSVPSATGDLVWGLIGHWYVDTLSGFSLTSRRSASNPVLNAGDGAGSASVAVSATLSAAREWGAVGLDIRPAGAATPTNQFFSDF